jgi:uncharacterized protein YbjT (DUF2867 family)
MDRNGRLVTVFGGSGFVGTQIVQLLARHGWRVRVAVRRPDLAQHLRPLGGVGQVMPIQANIRDADSVMRAVRGADAVINLVGIGWESGRQRFRAVHTLGARTVATAAKAAGATQLVHMSAIGADAQSPSAYARSKAQGEAEVLAAFPDAVIMRPSLVFGPGDGFFNLLGSLARIFPVLPLIGGDTRFQPVYVGDVAAAFVRAVEGHAKPGRVYELGGPEVLTHRQINELVLKETGRRNPLLPLSPAIARLIAFGMSLLPFRPLITADQVELLGIDNVVSAEAISEKRALAGLGIVPTAMGPVLPTYLWRFMRHGQFDRQTA